MATSAVSSSNISEKLRSEAILETLSYLKKIVQPLGNAPGIAKIIEKRPELHKQPRKTDSLPSKP